MSAFLGHIHYWLYRKIQLLVERENLILEKTSKVVDDLAEELHSITQQDTQIKTLACIVRAYHYQHSDTSQVQYQSMKTLR